MMAKSAFVLALLLVALLASAAVAWWRFLAGAPPDRTIWRRRVFVVGLAANSLSAVLFCVFTAEAVLISRGVLGSRDLIANYKLFLPVELSVAAVICGVFGRHLSRVLVVLSGLVLSFLWLNYGAISL
jgi:hypothetical protein